MDERESRRREFRQMAMIWVSQFLSITGFSFSLSFAPFFLQTDLGVAAGKGLEMYVALFSSVTAASMAVAAPIWGALADRYGKRIMLLRANFAGAVCMSLMSQVTSPGMLIALRTVQGALTGTMTAAQAFLSGETSVERRGFAMGGLSAAVYSGLMAGGFIGGAVARVTGYRTAFATSGVLLLLAGLFVLLTTEERGGAGRGEKGGADGGAAAKKAEKTGGKGLTRAAWTVLAIVGAVSLARQFDISFLPLLVQDIHGGVDPDVSLWSGCLNACGAVAGLLAGFLTGWLADRWPAARILAMGALFAGVFSGAHRWIRSFGVLFPVRFCTIFFAGMLEPALNAWLAKHVREERQGVAFGLASTMRSTGWAVGPLVAGAVAAWHLRAVFAVSAGMYFLLAIVFAASMSMGRGREGDGTVEG